MWFQRMRLGFPLVLFLTGIIVLFTVLVLAAAPTIEFVSPTPANGSTQSSDSIYVNLSTTADGDHYSFVDFDNSLVGWYRMDSANSSTVFDESSYSNNGTLTGNAFINESGRFGNASWYDGAGDSINLGASPTVNFTTENFTISLWFNALRITSENTLIARGRVSGSPDVEQYYIVIARFGANNIMFSLSNGTDRVQPITSNFVQTNSWYHLVTTWNGTTAIIYINGLLNVSSAKNLGSLNSENTIAIGRDGAVEARYFNGSIDEVIVFNRSLSASEIQALYNASVYKYSNNFTSLSAARHSFKGYAVDISGNKNNTEERQVFTGTDNELPVITVTSPTNTTYTVSNITINFSATDNAFIDSSWYYNETANVTYSGFTSETISDGSHTYIFYANDTSNNLNSTSITFFVNTSVPPTFSNYQVSPTNGTNYSQGAFYEFNVTTTANVDTVWIDWQVTNFTDEVYSRGSNVYSFNRSDLGAGTYNYTWWANNTEGTSNSSGSKYYTVSIGDPNVTIYLNNSITSNILIFNNDNLSINASIAGAGELLLYNNGSLINNRSSPLYNLTTFNTDYVDVFNITVVFNGNENFTAQNSTSFVRVIQDRPRAIARFDVVPHQVFNSTFNIGVIAFHVNGISSVTFNATDEAGNSTFANVTSMILNPRTNVWEYWTTLNASDYNDGNVNITAVAYPNGTGYTRELNLTLFANSGNSLGQIIKYVANNGSDYTGDGTIGNPFRTIEKASVNISDEGGDPYYASNGMIYLLAGDYNWTGNTSFGNPTTGYSWLTVSAAPGVSRDSVRIVAGGTTRMDAHLLKLKDLTIYNTSLTSSVGDYDVWLDNVYITQDSKFDSIIFIGGTTWDEQYWTNSVINGTQNGVVGTMIARNISIYDILSDAFQNANFVINSFVDGIDAEDSGAHPDVYQIYSPNNWIDNRILYNVKAINFDAQGLFLNPGVGTGNDLYQKYLLNSAFVNVLIEKNTSSALTSQIFPTTSHLLLWHIAQIDLGLLWRTNASDESYYLDVRNSILSSIGEPNSIALNLSSNNFVNNHFINDVTLGTNSTNGTAGFTNQTSGDYSPNETSILRNRIPGNGSQIVPADLEGTELPTDGTAAIGALQFQSGGSDTTAPSITLSAPSNSASVTSASQSFNATFTDGVQLANNTFYLWNSTGNNINTTTTTITGTSNSTNLSVTLPYEGTFTWNYLAYDNSSNGAFASSNFTITYQTDLTAPSVIIHSPRNRTYNNHSAIDVRYRATDETELDTAWYFVMNSSGAVIVANTTLTGNTTFTMPVTGSNFTFFLYANDTSNNLNNSENITFHVLNDRRYVRYEGFYGQGDTTNLDGLNDSQLANLSGFVLHEPLHGKIKFLRSVDLTNTSGSNNATDIDSWVNITSNRIELNSSAALGLNVSANLTLQNLTFTTPRILRDGAECGSICTQLSYSSGVLVFNVTGFSVYTTEEGAESSSTSESSSSSGGGGDPNYVPPFYTNTYVRDLNDLQFSGELVQGLKAKERVRIKIIGEKHHVGVISIEGNVVTIGVESEEQTAELKIAGSAKFDLNDDGFYDLIVVLKSLIADKAELGMKWVYEEVPAVPVEEKDEEIIDSADEDRSVLEIIRGLPVWAYWIALAFVIGLVILVFVLWQLSRPPHLRIVFRERH